MSNRYSIPVESWSSAGDHRVRVADTHDSAVVFAVNGTDGRPMPHVDNQGDHSERPSPAPQRRPPIMAPAPRASADHGSGGDGLLRDGRLVGLGVEADTHTFSGDTAYQDAVGDPHVSGDGAVEINGVEYPINTRLEDALQKHKASYDAAVIGPDAYPDLIMGQSVIHPKNSGKWPRHHRPRRLTPRDDTAADCRTLRPCKTTTPERTTIGQRAFSSIKALRRQRHR